MSKKNFNFNGNKQGNQQSSPAAAPAVEAKKDVDTTTDQQPDQASAETTVAETTAPIVSEPVAAAAPAAPEVPTVPAVKEELKAKSKTEKGFTPVYKVEIDLISYAEAMDNKKSIVPEEGGKWQYSLYNTIKSVLGAKNQEDFNKEFNTILAFFLKNKDGVFNEKWIFRFPEQWPGSPNEFNFFRRIVYLIIQTADPKGRKKALEDINMEIVTQGLPENQRNMLFNFYLM